MPLLVAATDGARSTRGAATWAWVAGSGRYDSGVIPDCSAADNHGAAICNAELTALIELTRAARGGDELHVLTDSMFVVGLVRRIERGESLSPDYRTAGHELAAFMRTAPLALHWVKAHMPDTPPLAVLADTLAVMEVNLIERRGPQWSASRTRAMVHRRVRHHVAAHRPAGPCTCGMNLPDAGSLEPLRSRRARVA